MRAANERQDSDRGVGDDHVDVSPLASAVLRFYEQQFDEPDTTPVEGPVTIFPQRWGEFELLRPLGQGAMGYVYEGRQLGLDRRVAIKVMRRGDPEARERFEREARSMARVHSPHVVQVFQTGVHDGRPFFAMEYVEGIDLARMLANDWPPAPEQALDLVVQAARGLRDAAAHDLIHRDLKPANMMLTCEGVLKLTDFGLARAMGDKDITLEGMVMGTPCYLSPEQASGRVCDQRSDIYSLGVVFYELLTGHLLFDGENAHAILYQHLHATPPSPREHDKTIPRAYERVLQRCLAKDPDDRYQSVAELLDALEDLQVGRAGLAASALGRGALALAVATLLVLALVVGRALGDPQATSAATPSPAGAHADADAPGLVDPDPEPPPQPIAGGPFARAEAALVAGDLDAAVAGVEHLLATHGPEDAYRELLERCVAADVAALVAEQRYDDAVDRARGYAERHFWLDVDEEILTARLAAAEAALAEDRQEGFDALAALVAEWPTSRVVHSAVVEHFGVADGRWVGGVATRSALFLVAADGAEATEPVARTLIHGWLQGRLDRADDERALDAIVDHWSPLAVAIAGQRRDERARLIAASDAEEAGRTELLAWCRAHHLLEATTGLPPAERWSWSLDCLRMLPDDGIGGEIGASVDRLEALLDGADWRTLAAGHQVDLTRIPILESASPLALRVSAVLLRAYPEPTTQRLATWAREYDDDHQTRRWNAWLALGAAGARDRVDPWAFHRDTLLRGDGYNLDRFDAALTYFVTAVEADGPRAADARQVLVDAAALFRHQVEHLRERLPLHAATMYRRQMAIEAALEPAAEAQPEP